MHSFTYFSSAEPWILFQCTYFHGQQLETVKNLLFSVSMAQNSSLYDVQRCTIRKMVYIPSIIFLFCFYQGWYLHKLNDEIFICFQGKFNLMYEDLCNNFVVYPRNLKGTAFSVDSQLLSLNYAKMQLSLIFKMCKWLVFSFMIKHYKCSKEHVRQQWSDASVYAGSNVILNMHFRSYALT